MWINSSIPIIYTKGYRNVVQSSMTSPYVSTRNITTLTLSCRQGRLSDAYIFIRLQTGNPWEYVTTRLFRDEVFALKFPRWTEDGEIALPGNRDNASRSAERACGHEVSEWVHFGKCRIPLIPSLWWWWCNISECSCSIRQNRGRPLFTLGDIYKIQRGEARF